MFVSIIREKSGGDDAIVGVAGVKEVNLVILEEDAPKDLPGGTILDITDTYRHAVEYMNQLYYCNNTLKVPIVILQLIAICGFEYLEKIPDIIPTLQLDSDHKVLHGTFEGDTVGIDLGRHDPVAGMLNLLHSLYIRWFKSIEKIGNGNVIEIIDPTTGSINSIGKFITSNEREICSAIYDEYLITKEDFNHQPAFVRATLPNILDKYIVKFIDTHVTTEFSMSLYFTNGHTIIENTESGETAYIGGLSFDIFIERHNVLEYISGKFYKYILKTMDGVLDNMRPKVFYEKLAEESVALHEYYDKHITNGDFKSLRYDPETNAVYYDEEDDNMKLTKETEVRTEGLIEDPETGEVMDSIRVKAAPDLTKLKWLLLYLMDTELGSKVAHGLPVYLYKDKKHGISAIFNYWQGLNSTEEKYPGTYIEFVERYAKYNMIVVTDLMEIAKSVNLDAYAEYIGGGEPYVRIIVNRNVYLDD